MADGEPVERWVDVRRDSRCHASCFLSVALVVAVALVSSVARGAPAAPTGGADFDCNSLEVCDPADMAPPVLARCRARAENDRCRARVEAAAWQALRTATSECKKPSSALATLVESIRIIGVGPHVIDGWDKLTDAEREAFDQLVEPLADEMFDGAGARADAVRVLCDPQVTWRRPVYADESGRVRVVGRYKSGDLRREITNGFYIMLDFERGRRAGESWSHYDRDRAGRHAKPPAEDRRWHYYGEIEDGLVRPPSSRPYDKLRSKIGGGEYGKAMAFLRATP